jgi:hypothetical protein
MAGFVRKAIAGLVFAAAIAQPLSARAGLILSADQNEVYDTASGLTWLANGNLPESLPLGLSCSPISGPNCIEQGGYMNFATALDWIGRLNQMDYEGHSNWQLPTVSGTDSGCTATGPLGNNFAFGCNNNALGSLYSSSLGLTAPNSALATAQNTIGPFKNFQPNNYWMGMLKPGTIGGFTFSFATGLVDSIVGENSYNDPHNLAKVTAIGGDFLNVLPMIQGTPAPGGGALQPMFNNQAVYDPNTGAIFAANANLAETFASDPQLMAAIGMSVCNGVGTLASTPRRLASTRTAP